MGTTFTLLRGNKILNTFKNATEPLLDVINSSSQIKNPETKMTRNILFFIANIEILKTYQIFQADSFKPANQK